MNLFIIGAPAFIVLLLFIFGKWIMNRKPFLVQDMIVINLVYLYFNLIYGIANNLILISTIIFLVLTTFFLIDSILPIQHIKTELLDGKSSVQFVRVRYGSGWFRKTMLKTSVRKWKLKKFIDYFKEPPSYNRQIRNHIGKQVKVTYMPLTKRVIKLTGIKINSKKLEFNKN